MKTRVPLILSACLALAACKFSAQRSTPAPVNVIASAPSEPSAQTARAEQLSHAAAAVAAATHANDANTPGAARETTEGELAIAKANLPTPAAADLATALERANAGLRGDLEAARQAREKALGDAGTLKEQIARLDQQIRDERSESARLMESREAQWNQKVEALKDEIAKQKDAMLADQARKLNWFAIACIAAGAVCVGFGGIAGAPKGAVCWLTALLAFATARIIGHPLFVPIAAGAVALVIGAIAFIAYRARKTDNGAKLTQQIANEAIAWRNTVVGALDKAKAAATSETSAGVDHVLEWLSSEMDKGEKAKVHEARAQTKAQAAA